MTEPTNAQKILWHMKKIVDNGNQAEAMTKKQLCEALCHLDKYNISSLESAVISESFYRLYYPWTWRIRRKILDIQSRYAIWKYKQFKK